MIATRSGGKTGVAPVCLSKRSVNDVNRTLTLGKQYQLFEIMSVPIVPWTDCYGREGIAALATSG